MDKFGIIGWPVAHSRSPQLFAQAYGGAWPYDLIGAPSFEECWRKFLDGGYRAINVTAPYKVDAFLKADIKAESAARTGAANIIVRTGNGLVAHNSDYLGVRSILETLPGIRTACVIGFGGAGRAALAATQDSGLDSVLLRHTGEVSAEGTGGQAAEDTGGQAAAENRFASLNPSQPDGWAPPSYGAEGGTDFRRLLPAGTTVDVIIYTLPKMVEWVKGLRCRYLLEANYKDPCLKDAGIAEEYIPGERWLQEQARCGYPLFFR